MVLIIENLPMNSDGLATQGARATTAIDLLLHTLQDIPTNVHDASCISLRVYLCEYICESDLVHDSQ